MLKLFVLVFLIQATNSVDNSLRAKTFYIYQDNAKVTWNDARSICEDVGGRLAMLDNKATQDALYAYSEHDDNIWKDNMNTNFWIGLNKKDKPERNFRWDGCEPLNESLSNWGVSEPQNLQSSHCVCGDKVTLKWRSDGCENVNQFLCETDDGPCKYIKGHGDCWDAEEESLSYGLTDSECEEKCSTEIKDNMVCWMYRWEPLDGICIRYFDKDPETCSLSQLSGTSNDITGLRTCFKFQLQSAPFQKTIELLYPDIVCPELTTTTTQTTPTAITSSSATASTTTTSSAYKDFSTVLSPQQETASLLAITPTTYEKLLISSMLSSTATSSAAASSTATINAMTSNFETTTASPTTNIGILNVTQTTVSRSLSTNLDSTVQPNDTCLCFNCLPIKTPEDRQKLVDYLTTKLKLDKSTLSSTRRKLESAQDERPSAKAVGWTGILVIAIVSGVFVLTDLLSFCKYLDDRMKSKTRTRL